MLWRRTSCIHQLSRIPHLTTCPPVCNRAWPPVQDNSHPANVLSRSAFSKVILTNRAQAAGGKVLHMKPTINEAIVRFQIW